jgi:peroxiredoxin Q/BCP
MKPGDLVPDFELLDDEGTPRKLSGFLAEGPVVLFFYPAALSSGCTVESCHFRDLAKEFGEVGAQRVGISPDEVGKQHEFSSKHSFDYRCCPTQTARSPGSSAYAAGSARC